MIPLVMGVLNVTPDSFSDGGRYVDPERAVAHGLAMAAEGADVVDVGGESTRPGAAPVDEATERRRVLPVVAALAPHVRVSIDTTKASVAAAALEAGATMVNDVSASLHDVAAAAGAGWVAMHRQGDPRSMQVAPHYGDVVAEVRAFLIERAEAGRAAGVGEVWIDPGIGFGKRPEHNLTLLHELRALVAAGYPVLVGTSRKSFLGRLAGGAPAAGSPVAGSPAAGSPVGGLPVGGSPVGGAPAGGAPAGGLPAGDRLEGSLATAVFAMARGASMVRVHDVAATVQAARLVGDVGA